MVCEALSVDRLWKPSWHWRRGVGWGMAHKLLMMIFHLAPTPF